MADKRNKDILPGKPLPGIINNPYFPGVLIFFIAFIVALLTYQDYGIAWDEPFQRGPGVLSYNYIFHGNPELFLKPNDNHGAGFELPLVIIEKTFNLSDARDIYLMRHLVTHIIFLIAGFSLYVLALKLFKNRFLASLGFLMLLLAPRLYAHSFFNSKDIPFLSMFLITLSCFRLAFDKNKPMLFLLLGFLCGYATSIRIMGIMLAVFIILFLLIDLVNVLLDKGKPKKIILNLLLFSVGFCFLLYISWPYLWKSPIHNFVESFSKLSRYEIWNGDVLLAGKFIKSSQLPWTYMPTWFLITVPELWLIAGFSGMVWIVVVFLKKPFYFLKNTNDRNFLLYLLCFFGPVISVIALHSIIYDDWRHLYFIYPSFILAGLYFVNKVYQSKYKSAVRVLCILQLALTGFFMVSNHPYSQVYFNHLVPHSPDYLRKNYELDYWGCSFKQGLDYIAMSDPSKKISVNCDYRDLMDNNVLMLPEEDRNRLQFAGLENADYYITNFRGHATDYPANDIVYSITVENCKILCVYKAEKDPAAKKKIWQSQISYLNKTLTDNPNDIDVLSRIANAYSRNGQYDSAEACYLHLLQLSPANPDIMTSLAGVYYAEKNYAAAIWCFKKMAAMNKADANPYSYIAVCFYYEGKQDSTVYYLKKAISIDPNNNGYYLNLANTYQTMGNLDSAKKYQLLYQGIK